MVALYNKILKFSSIKCKTEYNLIIKYKLNYGIKNEMHFVPAELW